MKTINFVSGGMMGDFIHSLFVVKNICEQQRATANLYIADGFDGDIWRYGLQKAYLDLGDLMEEQPWISRFGVYRFGESNIDINLNCWRTTVAHTHATTNKYDKCWTDLLSGQYNFQIPRSYWWVRTDPGFRPTEQKYAVIHRSSHHHNPSFPWEQAIRMLQASGMNVFFVSSNPQDWEGFIYKVPDIDFCQVKTMLEMARLISGAEYFVGNQSAPFALASALDVPRLCELDPDPGPFYMGEERYSGKISWFMNPEKNYIATNSIIQV